MSNNTIKIEFVTIFVLDILSSYERERVKDTRLITRHKDRKNDKRSVREKDKKDFICDECLHEAGQIQQKY